MPISYQFVDRKTNEPVTLASIDEAICRHAGVPCDPERYTFVFNAIVWVGLAMLTRSKRDPVDEQAFDDYMTTNASDFDDVSRVLFRKFLLENYIFTAWYQRH